MKTTTLTLFFFLLFICTFSFSQTLAPTSIKNSELISLQNQKNNLLVFNKVKENKEFNIIIDSKQDLAKAYHLLENKYRQLSIYKLRVLKA